MQLQVICEKKVINKGLFQKQISIPNTTESLDWGMRIIMNSNENNKCPWSILCCIEISPNVSPFDVSTVFQLRMFRPYNQRMLSATLMIFSVSFDQSLVIYKSDG